MGKFKYVIFDFDGTVADTREGVFESIIYALEKCGYGVPDEDTLNSFLGPALFSSFKRVTSCDDETAHRLVEKYRERYTDNAMYRLSLFDGVEDLLKTLKKSGVKLAIASSKPQKFFGTLLDYLKIGCYFDAVCGASFDTTHNSKQDIISRAIELLQAEKDKTLMVGDRLFDVEGAKANGIKCAGVVFGFDYSEELKNAGADFVTATAGELLNIIV